MMENEKDAGWKKNKKEAGWKKYKKDAWWGKMKNKQMKMRKTKDEGKLERS